MRKVHVQTNVILLCKARKSKKITQIKNLLRLILLLTSLTIFWGCEKNENTEKEETVVAAQDSIVGKWFQKNYEQSYFQNNGTVRSGGSSTVDFDETDFVEFKADGYLQERIGNCKIYKSKR